MRNLRLLTSFSIFDYNLRDVDALCIDPVSSIVYFLIGSRVYRLTTDDSEVDLLIDIAEERDETTSGEFRIVHFNFVEGSTALCLIFENGDVVYFDVKTEELKTEYSVKSGILAADWNASANCFAIVTGQDSVIILTANFHKFAESQIFSDDFGTEKPVTVGWGKKETQFHGSDGKSAALKKENKATELFKRDDGKPRISWNEEGSSFAISAMEPSTGTRRVYIFSADAKLQYTSEIIPGLECLINWHGPHSLLTSVQRLPDKYLIVFLEKNGLTHGELVLPFSDKNITVRGITWSSVHSALAIWISGLDSDSVVESRVQIWSMKNYHWYLKQSLILPSGKQISSICWHQEGLKLFLTTSDGDFIRYSWIGTTDKSDDVSCNDDAVVAVIDGRDVLVTPFAHVVVPPPYSAYKLTLPCQIQQILFPKHHSENKIAVVTTDNKISIFSKDASKTNSADSLGFRSVVNRHIQERILNIKMENVGKFPSSLHNWLWMSQNIFIAVQSTSSNTNLIQFSIDDSTDDLIMKCEKSIDGVVQGLISSCKANIAIIQLKTGEIIRYFVDENETEPWFSFEKFCPTMSTCIIDDKEIAFGLNDRNNLFCMDKTLPVYCTSFSLHDEFLLLTDVNSNLYCIPLTLNLYEKSDQIDKSNSRAIEDGSRIVTCVKNGTQVILQMPRGNIEAIHPRPLILNVVYKYLNELKFDEAFELMRKHRINMNLLFDYNPKKFLHNVDKFVSQIDNVSWINIFLTDLQEENVSRELYKTNDDKFDNKLNTVHSTVRNTLTKTDSKKFLLSILTTLVKMNPPELEQALNEVKNLDKKEKEDALNYLQYLMDINDLYDVALGTYDFDLVLMVAQKSQKDPKEYLPFLNSLRKMELNFQRFNIDCYLKKPEKALENIFKCRNRHFDKCLQHIKTHNLYKKAFKLFAPDSEHYSQLCTAYAEYLNILNKFDEAGIWFRRGGEFKMAMQAFEKCLKWKEAFYVAIELKSEESELEELSTRLVDRLVNERRFEEAAFIQEKYLKNVEESFRSLIDGHLWESALEMICRHQEKKLSELYLQKSVKNYCKLLVDNILRLQTNFDKYVARLNIVREEKKKKLSTLANNFDDDDTMSEAGLSTTTGASESTWMSNMSNISRQTAKNRRKHEKKKFSLKEGSVFEEGALVEALNQIVLEVDKSKEESRDLLRMLIWFGFTEDSELLQSKMDAFLHSIKQNLNIIWVNEPTTKPLIGPESTSNSIAAALQGNNNLASVQIQTAEIQLAPKLRDNVQWKVNLFS